MTPVDPRRHEEALGWVRRIQDPDFLDWEEHVRWLEAHPGNAAAFDATSTLIEAATDGLAAADVPAPAAIPVNDNDGEAGVITNDGRRTGRRWWLGLGIAAAAGIVGLITLTPPMPGGEQAYAIETGPGRQRAIALADGTRIALNGGSRIRLDHNDPRSVTIERGEAFFQVTHDATHPFAVRAGDAVFQDVGTAFDVVHGPALTEVAVRDGAVMFDPAGTAVRLDGGQAITVTPAGASIRQQDASRVGLWRRGRLSYSDANLATIARDIERSIGQQVTVDRVIEDKRFSGVIVIGVDRPRMFRDLAAVTGVSIQRDGAGWRMVSPTR